MGYIASEETPVIPTRATLSEQIADSKYELHIDQTCSILYNRHYNKVTSPYYIQNYSAPMTATL